MQEPCKWLHRLLAWTFWNFSGYKIICNLTKILHLKHLLNIAVMFCYMLISRKYLSVGGDTWCFHEVCRYLQTDLVIWQFLLMKINCFSKICRKKFWLPKIFGRSPDNWSKKKNPSVRSVRWYLCTIWIVFTQRCYNHNVTEYFIHFRYLPFYIK